MAVRTRTPLELLEEVTAAWRELDFDRIASCYAQGAVLLHGGVEIRGPTAIAKEQRKQREQFPDFSSEILRVFPGDGDVAWEQRLQGTNTGPTRTPGGLVVAPTGREVDFTMMGWLEAKDGLIVRQRHYYDQLVVLGAQLGLLDVSAARD